MASNESPSPRRSRKKSGSLASKILFTLIGLFITCCVVGFFVIQSLLENYLKSDAFRQRIETTVGHKIHATCTLAPLRRTGISLFSESLDLHANPGISFQTALIQNIRTDIDLGGIWSRTWKLDTIQVENLDLSLDPTPTSETSSDPATTETTAPRPTSWLADWLPNKTSITTIRAERCNIKKAGIQAKQTRLIATPSGSPIVSTNWDILAESGEISFPSLPTVDLAQAKWNIRKDQTSLRSARVLIRQGGECVLSGDFSKESGSTIHAQLENVNIEPFLNPMWQAKLKGNVQGTIKFSQHPTSNPDGSLEGSLTLKNGKLEALPILAVLDKFLNNPRFRSVSIKSASVNISKSSNLLLLKDIDLDGDGSLRIQGNISIESGKLDGKLNFGISTSLLQWLPGAQSLLFPVSRDGYLWTPVNISGTVDNPLEDLSSRLLNTGVNAATSILQTIQSALPTPSTNPANPNSTNPQKPAIPAIPDAARDATKGVLDGVKSLLPGR